MTHVLEQNLFQFVINEIFSLRDKHMEWNVQKWGYIQRKARSIIH